MPSYDRPVPESVPRLCPGNYPHVLATHIYKDAARLSAWDRQPVLLKQPTRGPQRRIISVSESGCRCPGTRPPSRHGRK
jgi:hypothetical protein